METIEIDAEVFAFLQRHARPFVDSPNSTLRRVLGIEASAASTPQQKLAPKGDAELDELLDRSLEAVGRSKAPKADLKALAETGLIRNGQKVYLIDYQGSRAKKPFATVSEGDLIYGGRRHSMSSLAQELLSQMGFKSGSVRGPAHWVTEDGTSIKDLWQRYLEKGASK
jgi:hypothetical protein